MCKWPQSRGIAPKLMFLRLASNELEIITWTLKHTESEIDQTKFWLSRVCDLQFVAQILVHRPMRKPHVVEKRAELYQTFAGFDNRVR